MLQLQIPLIQQYDSNNNEFITINEQVLQLEHSLVSISKWESKWHKSFLSSNSKTNEETLDYIRCMTITKNVNPRTYYGLDAKTIDLIVDYINDSMTATWFSEDKNKNPNKEIITSELIYYWMITLNIPVEFQKWHLNRLLTLIRVCNVKNEPPKKMSKREIMNRNKSINDARRKAANTTG